MNAQLQAQLDRVEAALSTLVDSIAAYNPSPAAAGALVSCDEEFCKGLEELAAHQASYNHLLQMRATAEALDERIKSNLTLLAETRKELITSTPVTLPTSSSRPVPFPEVLSYAQRIAKYTIPPTNRPPLPPPLDDSQQIKQEHASPQAEPVVTPPSAAAVTGPAVPEVPAHLQHLAADSTGQAERAFEGMEPNQKAWLAHGLGEEFTPWPDELKIRSGALARIQAEIDQGVDPADVDIRTRAVEMLTTDLER